MFHCRLVSPHMLLMFCLYDVAAAVRCPDVRKKVNDVALLQSCRANEGQIVDAYWKHNNTKVIDKDRPSDVPHQFKGRVQLNPNLSLTVTNLRLQDAGVFSFVSVLDLGQPPTIEIYLQVLDTISEEPTLTKNITWHSGNSSCTVWLDCSSGSHASFNWTVGGFSQGGRRLQRALLPEDGDVQFTCTAFNHVSQTSASVSVRCINDSTSSSRKTEQVNILAPVVVAGCSAMILVVVTVGVYWCKKQRAGEDPGVHSEYAVITDVKPRDVGQAEAEDTTLYETIDHIGNSVPSGVYDVVQFPLTGNGIR